MLDTLVRSMADVREEWGGVGGTVLAILIVIGIVIAALIALLVPD